MPFILFVIFMVTVGPCIIWGVAHEDKLIKIEDAIIAKIKHRKGGNNT